MISTPTLPEFESARLVLRPRKREDLDAVAAMNADPAVMRYITPVGDPSMSRDGVAARSFTHIAQGLGYWTVLARRGDAAMLGYVGLIPDGPDRQGVQLSYRFQARHWGKGYALEAAMRLMRHGFEDLGLPEIALITHPDNAGSLRLAERLGFQPAADHPTVLIGDPPIPGVHFRQTQGAWLAQAHTASGLNTR